MKTSTELLREGLNGVGFGYRSCAPMPEGEYEKSPQDQSREGSDGGGLEPDHVRAKSPPRP